MKKILKDYFTFSKKERLAVIILLLLIGSFIAFPYFYSPTPTQPLLTKALAEFMKEQNIQMDSVENVLPKLSIPKDQYFEKGIEFPFDPNIVSPYDLKRLGINDKTIHTMVNYRNKGGKFRQAEDLRKIWGFRKEDAERLIPFIRIKQAESKSFKQKIEPIKWTKENENPIKIKPKEGLLIDINMSTLEEWKRLPGIGEVLATRILKYRDWLGGFTVIDQVQKTYGISDSVFGLIKQYLTVNSNKIPRLDLNSASAYAIKVRTNIPDGVAKAIIVYRQQNGPYHFLTDLKKIIVISDSLYQKIKLHVSIE